MSPSFKDHPLTDAERLWLEAAYEDGPLFDPKIAKVRLHDKLPKGFDPKKIDGRFLVAIHEMPRKNLFEAVILEWRESG